MAPSPPLTPLAAGLAPSDLERLSAVTHAAVATSGRYGKAAKTRPRPTVTVMPGTQIVRVEVSYPTPPASKALEPGPLTVDVWTCPDQETALALFWLRKGGIWLLNTGPDDAIKRSVLDPGYSLSASGMAVDESPPGESAYRFNPRLALSFLLPKGHEPMPADRLSFVSGNVVVEVSTVEFTRRHGEKEWLAWTLRECDPDVVAVLRAIDRGLAGIAGPEELARTGPIEAGPVPFRSPSVPQPVHTRSSAALQSDWLDKNLPKLVEAMVTMDEARARVASPFRLDGNDVPPFPLTPEPDFSGLAPDHFNRLSALVQDSVAKNAMYGECAKIRPRPTQTVMLDSRIVRYEITYPAPPATKDLEASGPLTVDVWVCPDRHTALALFWLRKGGDRFLDTRLRDGSSQSVLDPTFPMKRSVLDARFHVTASELAVDGDPPGESGYCFNPRLEVSVSPTKALEPMPADRLSFLRGNVVVEASTVEYRWHENQKRWLATDLRKCAPDLVALLRRIDAGLIRFGHDEEPNGK